MPRRNLSEMPLWEMRLVSITAKWQGWSITNDKGYVVVRFRVSGRPSEQVSLPSPIRYREEDEETAINWIRKLYKTWEASEGSLSLKGALAEVKGTSDATGNKHATTWEDIAEALRQSKIDGGSQIQPKTWETNWKPFIDEAIKVLGSKNKPTDGYTLLKAVLKKWKHAPSMKVEAGRYLALFMKYAVQRYNAPRSWLITEIDKEELIPKKPKVRKKAVFDDQEILEFINSIEHGEPGKENANKGWANVFRMLSQYGLRPIELQYLSVEIHPVTCKPTFYCSYEKVGGADETKPRFIQPMWLRDEHDQKIVWGLEEAWAKGTLELPVGIDGNTRHLNGGAVNCFLHKRKAWKQLIDKYLAKDPKEWVRPYSFRDSYSVRSHREGVPIASICDSMGHTVAVHERSYRTITEFMVARDYESDATVLSV